MRQFLDKTTQRFKRKAGQAVDLLQSSSQHSRSTLRASSQQREAHTSPAPEVRMHAPVPMVATALAQVMSTPIPVAMEPSHLAGTAVAHAASPADIPTYAKAPDAPTIFATTGSAVKTLLMAARDGSDLFLPLKAALVGIVALWDVFNRTAEAKVEFAKLESKLNAISTIATMDRDKVDPSLQARLAVIVQAIKGLWEAVEQRQARGGVVRVMQSTIDLGDIKALNNAISSLMELFQFEGGIALQKELGELTFIAKRLDASEIERQERQRMKKQEKAMKTIKSVLGDNLGLGAADHEQPNYAGCMKGTRESVLLKFMTWVKEDPMAIFWLAGMAGAGKTSIAVSLCRMLRDDPAVLFGGGYFCSRSAGSAARTDVRRILPTLAVLLASKSQEFAEALAKELDEDQHVGHKPVGEQIDPLLRRPLAALVSSTDPIVFVIDALDECADEQELEEFLRLLVDFQCNRRLKFILTSRPELHIRNTPISNSAHKTILQLHTISVEDITSDIRLYIRNRLDETAAEAVWYTDQDVDLLVKSAGGLFIVASTVLKYILQRKEAEDRRDRLRKATSAVAAGAAATSVIDKMYELVVVEASRSDVVEKEELERTKNILACILTARTSLSVEALATLIGMTTSRLRGALERLHSLVHLPTDDNHPGLQTLHASFGDYLFGRAPEYIRIPATLGHDILAHGCLKRMESDDLCFNISQSRSSFELNPNVVPDRYALSLTYACLHWAHHLYAASDHSAFDIEIGQTFRPKFLFWLELLSVLGKSSLASGLLRIAISALSEPVTLQFLRDADAFVASSHGAISKSAPHIYLSALTFSAKDSLIYLDFAPLCSGLISVTAVGINHGGGRHVVTLTGHTSEVLSVAYSPNGRLLASGSYDATVRIWDTRTGDETMSLQSHDGNAMVVSVAFSPYGELVACGAGDGVVRVWSVVTGRAALPPLRGHSDAVLSVAFSSDSLLIASASWDRTVRLWSAETGLEVSVISGHTDRVNVIAFSPDGRFLTSASDDETICFWEAHTGEAVENFTCRFTGLSAQCLGFSQDGKWLAIGFKGVYAARILDLTTLKCSQVTLRNSSSVRSVAFSPDGSMVVLSGESTIRCWDPQSGQELHRASFSGHSGTVWSVAFSADGQFLASGSEDCTVRIWNAVGNDIPATQPLQGHGSTVSTVAMSSDGSLIVSGSYDRSVRVWDISTGQEKFQSLSSHADQVLQVVIASDNSLIASVSIDNVVRLWDMHTGEPIGEPIGGHTDKLHGVAFSPDNHWLAAGSFDEIVNVWEVATRSLGTFGPLECMGPAVAVAFSPDNRLLAAAADAEGGYIHFWHSGTYLPARRPLRVNSRGLYCLTISPDSTRAVTGARDHVISVWNISDGCQVARLTEHLDVVCSVQYSPDSRYIVSASDDKTIRLWDSQSGDAIVVISGHGDMVESATFTPDGHSIVSGSADGTIHVWDVDDALALASQAEHDPLARLGSATLNDGWLVGPAGELLLWVPAQYRGHIQLPPCTVIIGSHRVELTIDDNGGNLHWGDQWTKCWLGAAHPVMSYSS